MLFAQLDFAFNSGTAANASVIDNVPFMRLLPTDSPAMSPRPASVSCSADSPVETPGFRSCSAQGGLLS